MNEIPYLEVYKQFCKSAAENDEIFKIFRSHKKYTRMLEHVSYDLGQEYLNVIKDKNPHLLNLIHKFKENDKYGSPQVYDYDVATISPTTLRYIKVLSDIIDLFGNLENKNIIEMGGGYGGQCRVISCLFNYKSYTIVDLPEVCPLINRYLTTSNVTNANAIALSDLSENHKYDLFISNYAFTELPISLQLEYIDKVINKSEHGYITCNFLSENLGIVSMPKDELLYNLAHKHITILDEIPKSHPTTFVLVW
jgi:putative sugar O-methyltransferase